MERGPGSNLDQYILNTDQVNSPSILSPILYKPYPPLDSGMAHVGSSRPRDGVDAHSDEDELIALELECLELKMKQLRARKKVKTVKTDPSLSSTSTARKEPERPSRSSELAVANHVASNTSTTLPKI